ERLKLHWTSPAYTFFKDSVEIKYNNNGRKYQWFTCAATHCKGAGGVKRYQDKTDSKGTGNLITHARRCFDAKFVDEVCTGHDAGSTGRSGDIRAAFAPSKHGELPLFVLFLCLIQSNRVTIVRWLTEACCPVTMVLNRMFAVLMHSGCPHVEIPIPRTISRDVETCFNACHLCINELLKVTIRASYTTEAWTSPNHRTFVAFVAHIPLEGHVLAFLLDIVEVPEVCPHFLTLSK
ncbi:hypothetical protein FB107DRAFT_214535, partial [Schizophyllum commune]